MHVHRYTYGRPGIQFLEAAFPGAARDPRFAATRSDIDRSESATIRGSEGFALMPARRCYDPYGAPGNFVMRTLAVDYVVRELRNSRGKTL